MFYSYIDSSSFRNVVVINNQRHLQPQHTGMVNNVIVNNIIPRRRMMPHRRSQTVHVGMTPEALDQWRGGGRRRGGWHSLESDVDHALAHTAGRGSHVYGHSASGYYPSPSRRRYSASASYGGSFGGSGSSSSSASSSSSGSYGSYSVTGSSSSSSRGSSSSSSSSRGRGSSSSSYGSSSSSYWNMSSEKCNDITALPRELFQKFETNKILWSAMILEV